MWVCFIRPAKTGGGEFSAEAFLDEAKRLREALRNCESESKRVRFTS